MFLDYVRKSRKYYDEANALADEYRVEVGARFESDTIADIAATSDMRWQLAVENQKFMERLANMYGQVAVMNSIEMLIAEQRRTNDLLTKIIMKMY